MNKGKILLAGAGAAATTLVVIGVVAFNKIDDWFSPEPTGPGSGDEVDLGNGPGEPGPGSGDELPYEPEPTGPGSGDEVDLGNGPGEPGPGSGDEVDPNEPTGPGSGDEVPADEPTGPGSGDEVDPNEPTGPGSGEVIDENSLKEHVIGSCNIINESSTCVDYIGSFWATPAMVENNCDGVGVYSSNPCPRPTSGGCHGSAGTAYEMVIWYYPYGGDPVTGELIGYAAGTCNANPMSNYIYSN